LILKLSGDWASGTAAQIDLFLRGVSIPKGFAMILDLHGVRYMDTTGAWLLYKFGTHLQEIGQRLTIKGLRPEISGLLEQVREISKTEARTQERRLHLHKRLLYTIGEKSFKSYEKGQALLSFLGETFVTLARVILNPGRLKFVSLCHFMQAVGVNAIPIVGLISFLIGIVLVYQGADQLKRFGADIFTIDLLAISVLREIGILLTAIVVAGRSGSAYTAQLGFMKLNQEVDAMFVMGLSPFEFLIIPRVLALLIALPLLTFFSDMMGLLGGYVMSIFMLDLTFYDFFHHLHLSIKPWTFWTGIVKAPFFAFVIAYISCFEGFRVSGGAESVGRQTTTAVVESIFLVIVLDAAFSIVFSILRI